MAESTGPYIFCRHPGIPAEVKIRSHGYRFSRGSVDVHACQEFAGVAYGKSDCHSGKAVALVVFVAIVELIHVSFRREVFQRWEIIV
jgi:hypothetical protein